VTLVDVRVARPLRRAAVGSDHCTDSPRRPLAPPPDPLHRCARPGEDERGAGGFAQRARFKVGIRDPAAWRTATWPGTSAEPPSRSPWVVLVQ